MSAGESDIETDRVSWLHTTTLGFAPFIFDLNKGFGFSQLMDICKTVWEEIEGNENLAKKLVRCSLLFLCGNDTVLFITHSNFLFLYHLQNYSSPSAKYPSSLDSIT